MGGALPFCYIVTWLLTAQLGLGRPDGATESTCDTMEPSHGTAPQTRPFPYFLTSDTHKINSDGCVYFTIRAKSPHTFQGFMVQARGEREDCAVGIFTESEAMKLMECFEEPDNTATHLDDKPKSEVTLRWVPNNGYAGNVVFHVTVVKTMKEYWVRQKAKPVTVLKAKH